MLNRATLCLIVTFLVFINLSCVKLAEKNPAEVGEITVEELPYKDSIPASWGKLISVSRYPDVSRWVQLWFEDESGNIRMVGYNIVQNRMTSQARVFHRK